MDIIKFLEIKTENFGVYDFANNFSKLKKKKSFVFLK